MYIEEFTAAGPLTEDAVEALMTVAGRYTSALTLTVADRTVQLPVLPVCWTELDLRAGATVTVEAARGHRPVDAEDRAALRDFVDTFQRATAS
ncbi:hypothetical protein [Nocardia neocaledoniensis]|uniref:hypothetical protein n=1 Tax=Nocardia neocaledoniensis TaxID=236511 RepID=UPI00245814D3|nr:hypothetical protein [Nocardia neocaledoniensis]